MNSQLLEKIVQLEITISELSSKILAQDSHILSLEEQIESLKHEKSKSSKSQTNTCTQTSYDKLILEASSQTASESLKLSKYIQTDLILNKNFLQNDEISTAKKLLMAFEEVNKENSLQEDLDPDSKPEDSEKINLKTKESLLSLNFISALNLKSDLPVKEPCPKNISNKSGRKFSQESHVHQIE
jgi:hypothetical protein